MSVDIDANNITSAQHNQSTGRHDSRSV